eukprot:TRINITY_DN6740_c0_g1_i1.p1 TRINITY_DN6740_c0_g1~~TRINITY_DN6740_c0_g1_i1.p1  ORF type:complete len:785 (+),score=195.09 TRINITY_DN6740_c0_g1_i1:165-2519(+)
MCIRDSPYTVWMMVVGILVGLLHRGTNRGLGVLSESIDSWDTIDPHLLLYAFIPALLFGDSQTLNFHLIKRCFFQCLLLAGPGVVIGGGLMAIVAKEVLPYDWSWKLAFTFGSITAATDPVAVVGLLNELGASPKLTMVIAGESLMNDGIAIVGFTLFRNLLLGESYTAGGVIGFLFQVALGGPAVGLAFGGAALITLRLIKHANPDSDEKDLSNQTTLTFVLAYLSFFVGEHVAGVSGVLACVTTGVVIAAYGWPLIDSREALQHVWHVLEFMGNTIVFTLSGVIIASDIYDEYSLDKGKAQEYFAYMFVVYLFMVLIRVVMMIILYPGLCYFGYGLQNGWKDAFIGVWGGLRGAIGLILCLIIDEDAEIHNSGAPFVVLIGGATIYTLLINGVTTGWFLNKLGMLEVPLAKQVLGHEAEHYVHARTQDYYKYLSDTNAHVEYAGAQSKLVDDLVFVLGESFQTHKHANQCEMPADTNYLSLYSEVLLEMIRSDYWQLIQAQGVPSTSELPYLLLESVEYGRDFVDEEDSLQDWNYLQEVVENTPWYYNCIKDCPLALKIMGRIPIEDRNVYMVASCIRAHQHAWKRLQRLTSHLFRFCTGEGQSTFGSITRTQSESGEFRRSTQCETAAFAAFQELGKRNTALIEKMEECFHKVTGMEYGRARAQLGSRWLAGATLMHEKQLLTKYKATGLLPPKTYEELEDKCEEDLHYLLTHSLADTKARACDLGCSQGCTKDASVHETDTTRLSAPADKIVVDIPLGRSTAGGDLGRSTDDESIGNPAC